MKESGGKERFCRGGIRILLLSLLLLFFCGCFFRYGVIYFIKDPMESLQADPPVSSYFDSSKELLYLERGKEGLWRFDIPLSQVPPHFIKALLATEDFNFFHHTGVDHKALSRALWQNIFYRRRISGASTITMQLAGMTLPGKHTIFWKVRQILGAWKLEKHYSKERILTEYLNRIPFGGRFHGIECAALYYFGVSAKDLTPPQSALLCGLPQRPNYFRPDRHRERAIKRMQRVLGMMCERGLISKEEGEKWQKERELNFRDFQVPAAFQHYGSPGIFLHALRHFRRKAKEGRKFTLSLRKELSLRFYAILRNHLANIPDVSAFAALLVENATGKVLVYIGNNDPINPDGGEINMVLSRREAGSTLKPFLYGEAIEGGLLTAGTLLNDAPLRYGDYNPGNFDHLLYGRIPAETALSKSLNTPVIRLAAHLGVRRVETTLVRAGYKSFTPDKNKYPGLTIALGCGGCTLWEQVQSYRLLANGGDFSSLTLHEEKGSALQKNASRKVFSPGTCALISSMLRKDLGYGAPRCAWKTGTSSNCRDAWTLLYTPTHTLGVWFGNPSGKRSRSLVGARLALPAARELITAFREMDSSFSDSWKEMDLLLEDRELCSKTGLTPTLSCKSKIRGSAVPGIPLPLCQLCSGKEETPPPRILSPLPGEYFLEEGKKGISLPLQISSSPGSKLLLYINGETADPLPAYLNFAKEGVYSIKVQEIHQGKNGSLMIRNSSPVTLSIKKWQEKE